MKNNDFDTITLAELINIRNESNEAEYIAYDIIEDISIQLGSINDESESFNYNQVPTIIEQYDQPGTTESIEKILRDRGNNNLYYKVEELLNKEGIFIEGFSLDNKTITVYYDADSSNSEINKLYRKLTLGKIKEIIELLNERLRKSASYLDTRLVVDFNGIDMYNVTPNEFETLLQYYINTGIRVELASSSRYRMIFKWEREDWNEE